MFKNIFSKYNIDTFGIIPFSECIPANERLYNECVELNMQSVAVFAIPYKTGFVPKDSCNISDYARVYDYHIFMSELSKAMLTDLQNEYPEFVFRAFADHSPINEKTASAKAGLGVIGKNSLLITEKYGSFVFIGSIITDAVCEYTNSEIRSCISCGKCLEACPGKALGEISDFNKCISFINQKKEKTDEERAIIKNSKAVWGCDVCQNVCPMNQGKEYTPFDYFKNSYIDDFSLQTIESMTDEEFKKYPFSWRKRKVITDNFKTVDGDD